MERDVVALGTYHEVEMLAHGESLNKDVILWHEARDARHLSPIHDLTIKVYFAR